MTDTGIPTGPNRMNEDSCALWTWVIMSCQCRPMLWNKCACAQDVGSGGDWYVQGIANILKSSVPSAQLFYEHKTAVGKNLF